MRRMATGAREFRFSPRLARTRLRSLPVASDATPFHRPERPNSMDVVASAAVRSARSRQGRDQLAVRASAVALRLLDVARPAQFGSLMGSSDAVGGRSAGRVPMLQTLAVAGRTVQARTQMLVRPEVLGHGRMASRAHFVQRLLRETRKSRCRAQQQREGYRPHRAFFTKLLSSFEMSDCPASAMASFSSAESSSYTRCTPSLPKDAMPQT